MLDCLLNRRILVVDDNPMIHEDIKKILCPEQEIDKELAALEESLFGDAQELGSSENFIVESAYQGEEAIELIERSLELSTPYAIAFVDVRMPPGLDGIETVSRIWRLCPDLEVVICTAYSDYSWSEMIEKLGKTDQLLVLKKPFDNIEVSQLALAVTSKWNTAKMLRQHSENLEKMVAEKTSELKSKNQELQAEINAHEEAKESLKKTQIQLYQADKLATIGQLAAGVAHEINNPIGFIMSNLGTLKNYTESLKRILDKYDELERRIDGSDNSLKALLDEIKSLKENENITFIFEDLAALLIESQEGTRRVRDIVQNLKDFARVDDKTMKAMDINEGIETTIQIISNEIKSKCEIVKELSPLPPVQCVPGEINQVLMNLLMNAAHAIEEKGVITIKTEEREARIVIQVSDTGTGIPEENINKVFDPFFTTKKTGEGAGLGLSISHGIIHSHGGRIEVASEVGKGTTFTITLPVLREK